MKRAKLLLIVLSLSVFYLTSCQDASKVTKGDAQVNYIDDVAITDAKIPVIESDFTFLESKKINAVKEAIEKGHEKFVPAYDYLIRDALTSLDVGTFSINQKTQTPSTATNTIIKVWHLTGGLIQKRTTVSLGLEKMAT